jgi:hypothetical protein
VVVVEEKEEEEEIFQNRGILPDPETRNECLSNGRAKKNAQVRRVDEGRTASEEDTKEETTRCLFST